MKRGAIFLLIVGIFAMGSVLASSYSLEFNQEGRILNVNESINNTQNGSFVDSESLNFAGKEIYFLKKVVFSENFDEATIRLNLEKGIIVKDKEIFPAEYQILTDGETISIIWNSVDVKKNQSFAIFVSLENTSQTFSYYLLFVFIPIIVLIGFAFFLYSKKNRKSGLNKIKLKRTNKRENVSREYGYLLDTEKKVIEELKKADRNELWQRQIQTFTGFSKAKVSRLVRNLESRGLINKIPFGNTNKIRLK